MRSVLLQLLLSASLGLGIAACESDQKPVEKVDAPKEPPVNPPGPGPDAAAIQAQAKGFFQPLPDWMGREGATRNEELISLGRMLYYDPRISRNQEISCNTCHQLDKFGVDNEPTSPGHKGVRGERNSPTVYNAALHVAQFWDGREPDVELQALGPVLNPVEMAMASGDDVILKLKAVPGYAEAFKKVFPDDKEPVTYENFGKAVGAFERGLVTPSPFDRFLEGDTRALTDAQLEGLKTFMEVGCTTCHNGVGVGGGGFFKMGLVRPYETEDLGRYNVTKNEADKYVFKVPGLRNIAKTGPYFHDGKVKGLEEAVRLMGAHQLGRDLTDEQVKSIIAFLESLTGDIPTDYIAMPQLPEAGPGFPPPDKG